MFWREDMGFEARQGEDIDAQPAPDDGMCALCFNAATERAYGFLLEAQWRGSLSC